MGIEGGAEETAAEGLCLMLLVLSFSIASTSKVLLASEGRGVKTCLHWGQLYWPLPCPLSQWLWIQTKQYECPQGSVAGSFRVSRHTGQAKVSSSGQAEAMWCRLERRRLSYSFVRGQTWVSGQPRGSLFVWVIKARNNPSKPGKLKQRHPRMAGLKCQFTWMTRGFKARGRLGVRVRLVKQVRRGVSLAYLIGA